MRPIPFSPYRAGPKAREFEKNDIAKMLELEFIEPAETKWDLPTVLALRRTARSDSMLDTEIAKQ